MGNKNNCGILDKEKKLERGLEKKKEQELRELGIERLLQEALKADREPEPYLNERIFQQWKENDRNRTRSRRCQKRKGLPAPTAAAVITGVLAVSVTIGAAAKYLTGRQIVEDEYIKKHQQNNITIEEETVDMEKDIETAINNIDINTNPDTNTDRNTKTEKSNEEAEGDILTRMARAGYLADEYSAEDIIERAVLVEESVQEIKKEEDGLSSYIYYYNEADQVKCLFKINEVFEKKVGYSKIVDWFQDDDYRDYILCYRDKKGTITGYVYREQIDSKSLPHSNKK